MELHFYVSDVRASTQFYCRVLGFELIETWPDSNEYTFSILRLNKQTVMLCNLPNSEPEDEETRQFYQRVRERAAQPGALISYFSVDDVDRSFGNCVDEQAKVICRLADKFWGQREFIVEDLDGHWLAFYQPLWAGQ